MHINRSAGMEIYDVVAKDSKFFGHYIGYPFPQIASNVHRKTGAMLFAVERNGHTQLNPGKNFKIDEDDVLYYICLTHENDSAFTDDSPIEPVDMTVNQKENGSDQLFQTPGTKKSQLPFSDNFSEWTNKIDAEKTKLLNECKHDFPPLSPYLGYITPTLCYIRKIPMEQEEMKLKLIWEFAWPATHIIVCAEGTDKNILSKVFFQLETFRLIYKKF